MHSKIWNLNEMIVILRFFLMFESYNHVYAYILCAPATTSLLHLIESIYILYNRNRAFQDLCSLTSKIEKKIFFWWFFTSRRSEDKKKKSDDFETWQDLCRDSSSREQLCSSSANTGARYSSSGDGTVRTQDSSQVEFYIRKYKNHSRSKSKFTLRSTGGR